jgi:hypothetical protein
MPRFSSLVALSSMFTSRRAVIGFAFAATLVAASAYGVHLYFASLSKPQDLLELEAQTILSDPRSHAKLIRTADADYRYNCHGWTFTRGQREVHSDEVEQRLKDEYHPTENPQLDDVVVYRDHRGDVMHSGVVKAVGQDGFVLVESKWGTAGRFIHEPSIARTFRSFQFYHKVTETSAANRSSGDKFGLVKAAAGEGKQAPAIPK